MFCKYQRPQFAFTLKRASSLVQEGSVPADPFRTTLSIKFQPSDPATVEGNVPAVLHPLPQPESESLVSEELDVELLLVSESELELEALRRDTDTGWADSAFSLTAKEQKEFCYYQAKYPIYQHFIICHNITLP